MTYFSVWNQPKPKEPVVDATATSEAAIVLNDPPGSASNKGTEPSAHTNGGSKLTETTVPTTSTVPPPPPPAPATNETRGKPHRFALPTFFSSHKVAISAEADAKKKKEVVQAAKRASVTPTKSEKRARDSAIIVQAVITGSNPVSPDPRSQPNRPGAVQKSQLEKVKSQLLQPKTANEVIAQLRTLPAPGAPVTLKTEDGKDVVTSAPAHGPIHAICLMAPEEEVQIAHFSKLASDGQVATAESVLSISTASLGSVLPALSNIRIVSFLITPDLGIGQPGDGRGLLSGSVPTAETVMNGIAQLTPQLMALGYATDKAVIPDHTGIYPPLDRMSILTYWWGLELALPPPSMKYLGSVKSIANTVVNFLTALSVIDSGVREILPFIRYISQFLDFEWNAIKAQDKGKGVVCASTWIMPAALAPRPWDFPEQLKNTAVVPKLIVTPPSIAGSDGPRSP